MPSYSQDFNNKELKNNENTENPNYNYKKFKKEYYENQKCKPHQCFVVSCHHMNLCVPVTVKPTVCTGEVKTICCGEPVIVPDSHLVKNNSKCNDSCRYIISQNIYVEVPLEISAHAFAEDPHINCEHGDK
jgi:hypothetical protein